MVFTLHRYIFRELLKVFLLASLALAVILSLGSILRPVQEYGVGPRQVVAIMLYFLPITLTFVLPMAALFAGALVYGRFASDNELDACRASGVSLLTLVYPGLVLAIIVAIANLVLSFYVMPVFVHLAEKSLKADAKQILFRNVQRRPYYKLPPDGRYLIYADEANLQDNTLSGVVVCEVKSDGIQKIIAAQKAKVSFNPSERFQEVQITAYKTDQMGSGDEMWFYAEWLSVTSEFGSLLSDDIKFKKIDEMKVIKSDLMQFYPIAKSARETFAQLTVELLAQDIANKMAGNAGSFYRLHSGEKLVEFTCNNVVTGEKKVELSGDVVVIESNVAGEDAAKGRCSLRVAEDGKVILHLEGDELAPTLTMDIYNAKVEETGDLKMRHIIRGLVLPQAVEAVTTELRTEDGRLVIEGLARRPSALRREPSREFKVLQSKLQREMQKTLAQIGAEIQSRLVFGIGCVPMILIGISLGIIKKGGHLLSAFGASCVPAGVLIVCIMSGKDIAKNLGSQSISGVAVMWAGLAVLSLFAIEIYRRLLRH
jgi:lipopolysaccharide export LptBFGC system permease protein LptF